MTTATPVRQTKLDTLKAAAAREDWREVFAIAAAFPELGAERAAILDAHTAMTRPAFVTQLGKDPVALILAGQRAVMSKWLTAPVARGPVTITPSPPVPDVRYTATPFAGRFGPAGAARFVAMERTRGVLSWTCVRATRAAALAACKAHEPKYLPGEEPQE
jgi:hypothetical protein